jgi:hypothetical protein
MTIADLVCAVPIPAFATSFGPRVNPKFFKHHT